MSNHQALVKLYYDPSTGFLSTPKFWLRAKSEIDPRITYTEVKNFLDAQKSHQLVQQPHKRRVYRSVLAAYPFECIQIDFMIYDRYTFRNYKYILSIIDVFSRRAWAFPMSTRAAPKVLEILTHLFDRHGFPKNVNCDQEFVQAKILKDFFVNNGVTVYASDPDELHKNAIVESFHRTLALMLQRWREAQRGGLRDWPKVLPQIINNYNTTVHSTTKQTPMDMWERKAHSKQDPVYTVPSVFKLGDIVRVMHRRGVLEKGDVLRYSRDAYEVIDVEGSRYKLRNMSTGAQPTRRYKEYELVKAGMEEPPLTETIPGEQGIERPRSKPSQRKAAKELQTNLVAASQPLPEKRQRKAKDFSEFIEFEDGD